MARGIKKMVHDKQLAVANIYPVTTQLQADHIMNWFCNRMGWPKFRITFARKFKGRKRFTNGTCFWGRKEIVLYKTGEQMGTLLHEIAHIKECHHKPTFWLQLMQLIKIFETEYVPKFLTPTDVKIFVPTPEDKKENAMFSNEEKLQYVMEILEEHIQKDSIKMRHIGKTLLDEGMNSKENIMEVIKRLHEKNIFVIREIR